MIKFSHPKGSNGRWIERRRQLLRGVYVGSGEVEYGSSYLKTSQPPTMRKMATEQNPNREKLVTDPVALFIYGPVSEDVESSCLFQIRGQGRPGHSSARHIPRRSSERQGKRQV